MKISCGVWILGGDFNEVRKCVERQNTDFIARRATLFNNFIDNNGLVKIPIVGKRFTRISDDGVQFSKLDHFLVSNFFLQIWENPSVISLDRKLSDHSPLLLRNGQEDFGPKSVRIFDVWLKDKGAEEIVINKWNKPVNQVEVRILTDLERKEWIEDLGKWVRKDQEKGCMLRQKSRLKWASEGDENTKYFHSMIKRKDNKNKIRGLYINGFDTAKITFDDASMLEDQFSEEEVWNSIRDCDSSKAPGPDEDVKRRKDKCCVFKADIEKAFDSVNWNFC
ncbi:uncharacterized protein [Rutidosis leptorrhynchoides]|uniref:uncharacterized protein n=1 Tax=Rutidosis leptorrhynchoides TaxID=125765 RepID=UPI003A99416C